MIRKLSSGEYRLYSRKTNPKTGKRRNLGTFKSRAAAERSRASRKASPARRLTSWILSRGSDLLSQNSSHCQR